MSITSSFKSMAALATLIVVAAVLLDAATAGASPRATYPTADGVDYHSMNLKMRWHKIAELPYPNCTGNFGVDNGECGGISDTTSSDPSLGGEKWHIAWNQCNGAPIPIPECHPGWLAIQVWAGNAWFHAYMKGRNQGELYYLRGTVPAWHAVTSITAPDPYTAGASQPGGPLFIDVKSRGPGNQYDVDIRGHLLYKHVLQTFDVSGYLDYGTVGEPLALHPFRATLEVLDTPSAPKCNQPNFQGAGGCIGTFSSESNAPFVGAGSDAGIHWRKGDETLVELVAPSGSRFRGQLDGSVERFKVESGEVPEWNLDTGITTATYSGKPGEKGGPLRITTSRPAAEPVPGPATRVTKANVNRGRHRAKFEFIGRGRFETSGFKCKLDKRRARRCSSPKTYKHLGEGRHAFKVKAKGYGGSTGKPTKRRFRI